MEKSESLIEKAVERLTAGSASGGHRDAYRRSAADVPLLVDGRASAIDDGLHRDGDLQRQDGLGNAVISGALPWLQRTAGGKSRSVELDLERLENRVLFPKSRNKRLAGRAPCHKTACADERRRARPEAGRYRRCHLVTSAMPGEGKTFLAVNLAISIAMDIDRTALLIDADAAQAKLTRVLGLRSYGGLTDVISGGESDLHKVLLSTNIERLKILPAGTRHAEMADLCGQP